MLTLSNNSCTSIKATSEYLDDVMQNINDYDHIELEVKVNCCTDLYTDTIQLTSPLAWKSSLPKVTGLKVHEVWFRNLITGQDFQLPWYVGFTGYPITTIGDFTGLTTIINDFFQQNFSIGTIITGSALATANFYEYTLANFDENFVPIKMVLEADSTTVEVPFQSSISAKNTTFTSDGITFGPLILGEQFTSLIDGVYSVKVTIIKKSGSRVTETNCLFFDCETKCLLSEKLPKLDKETQIEALMMHHGLITGNNCGCDCTAMCDLYKQLYSVIHNPQTSNPQIGISCGC